MTDCIIVGAGFSGLAAALRLTQGGASVLVLEARDRVGGRTEAAMLAGITVDVGGMWMAPSQTRLAAMARQYGIGTFTTSVEGRSCLRIAGRAGSGDRDRIDGALTPAGQAELGNVFARVAALTAELDTERPWGHPDAVRLDGMTVQSWMEAEIADASVQDLIAICCRSLFCAEPAQLSLLYFLFYAAASGGLDVLVSADTGGAQNLLFDGGVHQIAARIAAELGDSLRLSTPVCAVSVEGGVGAIVHTQGGAFGARRVIMATPPALTAAIRFDPNLPPLKRGLIQRQPMGSCIKVLIAYARPFWRDRLANGFVLNMDSAFTPILDVSPPGAGIYVLAGFFDGDAALAYTELSPDERRAAILREVADWFGEEALSPLDLVERDWTRERWSQGCYGGYMAPGTLTTYGPALRWSHGPIHWAGTETSSRWAGYIEGAILAGERAADEVLAAL